MPSIARVTSGGTDAPKPTASTASIKASADAEPQTRAHLSACETSARETPLTLSRALRTVVPQFRWHIMPSIARVVISESTTEPSRHVLRLRVSSNDAMGSYIP